LDPSYLVSHSWIKTYYRWVWFGFGQSFTTTDDYAEGSPFDRFIFLILITTAIAILVKRGINWGGLARNNKWLLIFFLYLGVSVLWSDYSFVSFKRWIKDLGNIVMALVVLTESHPVEALKSLLGKCCYVLIPVNILLVKYFPETGRYYNQWTYVSYYGGATMDKNMLGMTLFVLGVSQFWVLSELKPTRPGIIGKLQLAAHYVMPLMTFWLLYKSQSSTAVACTILALSLSTILRVPAISSRISRLVFFGFVSTVVFVVMQVTVNLGGFLLGLLGRDFTFTGRTEIWDAVLSEDINPVFGTGYYSFWLGERVERLSEKYFYHLNEAHNGFIEIYLNNGLLGLFLLAVLYYTASRRICADVTKGSRIAALQLSFLVAVAIYGITEAVFRFGPIWFVFLLFVIEYTRRKQGDTLAPTR